MDPPIITGMMIAETKYFIFENISPLVVIIVEVVRRGISQPREESENNLIAFEFNPKT